MYSYFLEYEDSANDLIYDKDAEAILTYDTHFFNK